MAADTRIFADDPESRVHPIVTNLSEYVREIRSRMILEAQEQARLREQLGPDISDPAAVSLMQRQLMQEGDSDAFSVLDLTDPENYFAKIYFINMQKDREPEVKTQSAIEAEIANAKTEKDDEERRPSKEKSPSKEKTQDSKKSRSGEKSPDKGSRQEKQGAKAAESPNKEPKAAGENPNKEPKTAGKKPVSKKKGRGTAEKNIGERKMGPREKADRVKQAEKSVPRKGDDARSTAEDFDRKKDAEKLQEDRDVIKSPSHEAAANAIRPDGRDVTKQTSEYTLKKAVTRAAVLTGAAALMSAKDTPSETARDEASDGKDTQTKEPVKEAAEKIQETERKAPDTRGARYRQAKEMASLNEERKDTPQEASKTPEIDKDRFMPGKDITAEKVVMREQPALKAGEPAKQGPGKIQELSAENPRRDINLTFTMAKDMAAAGVMMRSAAMFTHTFDRPMQFKLGKDVLTFEKEGAGMEAETFAKINGRKVPGDEATKFFADLQRSLGPAGTAMLSQQLAMAARDPYQGRTKELLAKEAHSEPSKSKTADKTRA